MITPLRRISSLFDTRHMPAVSRLWLAAALALPVILLLVSFRPASYGAPASSVAAVAATTNPRTLSASDRSRYTTLREAQAHGDFARANALLGQVENRLLLGHVLAARYLDTTYPASHAELADWLSRYSDHPETARMAKLAAQRGIAVTLPKNATALRGKGYTDHEGRNTMPDHWFTALGLWRDGNHAQARPIFARVSADESLSQWQRAAAYYWVYRADKKLENMRDARTALAQAASYQTTFYGLLARAQMGMPILTPQAPEVPNNLRDDPRAIRAALLVQLGDTAAAEEELRALYSALDKGARGGIVTLASELGLSNLQMRLARTAGLSNAEQLFAQYPAPHYMLDLHSVMDAALLLAVARNESGFREIAHSPSGAVGMMQMLPSTARAVERHVGEALLRTADASGSTAPIAERLSNPALSARYGAEYLKLLTAQPAIGRDLIHLLVGYNAGPGTVANWKAAARTLRDPLLYIESIPYAETRNYVMQVAAQYWVYQRMMDETPTSLYALAKSEWPQV